MKKILRKEKTLCYLLILFSSMILCMPLLNSQIDMTYDDGIQHICRLMGTWQSIEEGQPFAVIMSEFCNGFGYSWNIFYSPLTAFFPLIFHLIGANFTICIKIFLWLCTFLSGIFMFQFVQKVTRNNKIGIIAAIIYIFVPYRLTDMYIRNALAEYTTFVFFPLVFDGLYTLFHKKNKWGYKLTLGAVGLILTHTVITMYMAIFALLYVLINVRKLKQIVIWKKLAIHVILILAITAFFWVPLLEHALATNYEVFMPGRMERNDANFGVDILSLFFTSKDNSMIFELGFVTIMGLLLCIPVIKKWRKHKKNSIYALYIFSLIAGLISIIMSLDIFPFAMLPGILKMLQFPFRMLTFASFFLSLVVAINIGIIAKKIKTQDIIIVLVACATIAIALSSHAHYLEEEFDENKLWPAIPVTENTGRVHAGCATFEYLPSKAFENLEYIKTRESGTKILEGSAQIENEHKEGSKAEFDIQYVLSTTKLELPYIYYLGYTVTLESDGNKEELTTYETENGFIGITLPVMEKGHILVEYKGTVAMYVSTIISSIAVILSLVVGIYMHYWKTKKQGGLYANKTSKSK